jgi:heme-degrading monooxygenase HmoA
MHAILWRFTVKPGLEAEFERHYGPMGIWATFFRQGAGYVRTELLRDLERTGLYFTLDLWETEDAFRQFERLHQHEYSEIDRGFERLTESEQRIGAFETTEPDPANTSS